MPPNHLDDDIHYLLSAQAFSSKALKRAMAEIHRQVCFRFLESGIALYTQALADNYIRLIFHEREHRTSSHVELVERPDLYSTVSHN
jgi:predicted transglutaminase-like protease